MGSTVTPQFTIEPPDQNRFEIEAPTPDTSGTGFWSHVGQSLRSLAPKDIPSFSAVLKQAGVEGLGPGYQAMQALHNAATEYAAARERGHGVPYSAAAGASTAVGVSPERMEQAASQGDTAGVLGEAAVPTALAVSPLAGEAAGKVLPGTPQPLIDLAARVKANKGALMTMADVIQHPEQIPGRLLKEGIKRIPEPTPEPVPTVSKDPFALTSPDTGTEPAIQTSLFPQPPSVAGGGPASFKKLTLSPGEDLGLGMGSEHTITNPQGQRIGSAQIEMKPDGVAHVHWLGGDFSDYGRKDVMGAIQEAYPNAEKITYDRRRLAKGADAATTTPRQMNVAQAPSVDDVVNQATGNKPLNLKAPFRDQPATTPRPASAAPATEAPLATSPKVEPPASSSGEQDPLKLKYPDPAQRQMVRANGERIVQAIGDDKETMDAVHGLTRVDLRQALINDGVDMGQRTVSNSKFAGEGSITREDAFNQLLARGHSPQDIVKLAKKTETVPQ
jgi:hypothetical protein